MATVVFLSPNPAASRRLLQKIQRWIAVPTAQHVELLSNSDSDALTASLLPSNPLLKLMTPRGTTIDSLALPLANDSLLHCLSLRSSRPSTDNKLSGNNDSTIKLLAIQSLSTVAKKQTGGFDLLLQESRNRLASAFQNNKLNQSTSSSSLSTLRIMRSAWSGRGTASVLQQATLPLLDFGDDPTDFNETATNDTWNQSGALKEIVIPSYPTDTYSNGESLFTTLQQSTQVHRPMSGLYQLPQGLCIRPLPAAKEDRNLPPPSLIFHTNSLKDDHNDHDAAAFKIGFSGLSGKGQIMLHDKHEHWGVDVRLCAATKPSSMFSEAQESLLASSLKELQSAHVMPITKHSNNKLPKQEEEQRTDDPNTNKMDCWVEFRANVKHPAGYMRRKD